MSVFWLFIIILILQRLSELLLAKRNERYVRAHGAVEYDGKGYLVIVLMHIAFFISLVTEYIVLDRTLNPHWLPLLVLFLLTQILRYWAISTLGYYWNTKILIIPGSARISTGPYKYINHPNYLAVVTEIAVIPLLFSCYITAIVFTILNIALLKRRIRIEEEALRTLNHKN